MRKKRKLARNLMSVFLLTALLLAACTGGGGSGSEGESSPSPSSPSSSGETGGDGAGAPVSGGELVFALATSPSGLDPNFVPGAVDYRVMRAIYDSLVVQLPDHTFAPWLAESWTVSEDGKTYTFKLREDVKFHDGTPFNAEAVKFNFDRIVDPATGSRYAISLIGPYESSEVIDEYTIAVHLKTPYEPFLNSLSQAFLGIVSPAAVEKYGEDFLQNPVGTGPFRFVHWKPNEEVVLERNPDYNWGPSNAEHTGPAYLDRLVFKIVPEEATRVSGLQNGQLDVIETVPPQLIDALNANPNLKTMQMDSTGAPHILMLNQNREPWNDVRARQAVQAAIDMDTIVRTLYLGHYKRAYSPLTPTTLFYNASLEGKSTYDLDKANRLLDELGWTMGPDGIRQKDGKKLTLRYLESSPNREKRQDIATMIQQQLKAAGIDVQLEIQATNSLLAMLQGGDYDLAGTSLVSGDPDVLRSIFHSSFRPDPAKFGFNLGQLNSPEIDEKLAAGLGESDPAKREAIYMELQETIIDQALGMPTYVYPYILALNKNVNGVQFDALAYPVFYDAWIAK